MSLTLFDPDGSSLRMCLLSALAEQTGFSGTWRESVTPAGRSWWVLTILERPTAASECSSLPDEWQTATASMMPSRRQVGASTREPLLPDQAEKHWPTATVTIPGGNRELHMERKRKLVASGKQMGISCSVLNYEAEDFPRVNWPTAGANDHKGTAKVGQRRGQLDEAPEQIFPPVHQTSHDGEWCLNFTRGLHRPRLNPWFVEWLMGFPSGWVAAGDDAL